VSEVRPPLPGRDAYRAWHRVSTRWSDNDQYGHANNVAFYAWFDSAVNAWLIGEGLLDPADGQIIGFVAESGCRYARPLSFPQEVEIGIAAAAVGRSSVTWRLGVFEKGETDAAAVGRFVHVYVGRADRRPVDLPENWRRALETITAPP